MTPKQLQEAIYEGVSKAILHNMLVVAFGTLLAIILYSILN